MSHVITGVNDICTKAPLLAKEWDYDKNKSLTPNQISYGSHAKYWWICERGHHYQAVVKDRYRGNGCPVCKRLKRVIKGNSLSLISPNNAEMWDIKKNNIKLKEISGNSAYNAWWICPKGHTWQEPVHHRIRTDSCPICSGRKLVPGINDINTLYPDIIEKEWDFNSNSQNPSQIKPTSIQKVHWICKKGHRYSMSPHHRLQRHQCCPYCAGKYPVIGINDLFTSHPELKNMWDYDKNTVNPTSLSSGSSKKAWWKCSSGHSWSARVSHIAKKRSGCPICAESGGAKAVKDVLDALCIEYKCEYIIPDRGRLRDDFAIFKDNSLVGTIEYNGQQHYSPVVFKKGENAKKSFKDTVERDIRKRKYLIEHDIPQLVIPYNEIQYCKETIRNFCVKIGAFTDQSLSSLTFVITGSVHEYKNRDEFKASVETRGGKVAGSVSAKTSFLVNNDVTSTSGKNKKAKELGIEIISEDEFISRFGK